VCEVSHDGRRFVAVASTERYRNDTVRTAELEARSSSELRALEIRVNDGRLKDKAKIGQGAGRILARSGVVRLFDFVIGEGHFVFHYDQAALDYEEQLLVGRYVLATSLSAAQASASEVLRADRRLLEGVDLPGAQELHRPASRLPLDRSPGEGHMAVCVLGAVIEALIEADPRRGDVRDPDLADQVLSPRLALRELDRIRAATILAGDRKIDVVTRRSPLQAKVLAALGVDTSAWDCTHVS
jgi:hypothetical protein